MNFIELPSKEGDFCDSTTKKKQNKVYLVFDFMMLPHPKSIQYIFQQSLQ
jgi:hypothetical protein